MIENNEIYDNNAGDDPMTGGSGISIYGYSTDCKAKLRNNNISGNYWGITAIYYYDIDMGTADDYGYNIIYDNHNNGYGSDQTYALYVNGFNDITAIGNYWGGPDEAYAESVIYHRPDLGETYGLVTYSPVLPQVPTMVSQQEAPTFTLYPNPAPRNTVITLSRNNVNHVNNAPLAPNESPSFLLTTPLGQPVLSGTISSDPFQLNLSSLPAGLYFITINNHTQKLLIQ